MPRVARLRKMQHHLTEDILRYIGTMLSHIRTKDTIPSTWRYGSLRV